MKIERIRREIALSLVVVLTYTICCVSLISMYSNNTLGDLAEETQLHARAFAPAKRISYDFEREILNARIAFIYFVTIQKPGMLDRGWTRYRNAENSLKDLAILVNTDNRLADLRPKVAELQQNLADYNTELRATLNMVQGGETKGAHYDGQVNKFFARGNALTANANAVQNLAYRISDIDTNATSDSARSSQKVISFVLLASILLCVLLTVHRIQVVKRMLANLDDPTGSDSTVSGSGPSIIDGTRIIPSSAS